MNQQHDMPQLPITAGKPLLLPGEPFQFDIPPKSTSHHQREHTVLQRLSYWENILIS